MGGHSTLKVYIEAPQQKGGMPLIAIPPEIAEPYLGDKNKRRMVLTFENGKKFHRALQRNKDGFCFMVLGKSTLKEAGKIPGAEAKVILEVDNSKYGMPMPEEFAEVLRQEPEGKKAFLALTPGLQRSFLFYINGGKSIDTRIRRSLKLIENLKQGIISAGKQS